MITDGSGDTLMNMNDFQKQVAEQVIATVGSSSLYHKRERALRVAEEVSELLQASGLCKKDFFNVIDYVYARPIGEVKSEVGDALITIAGLATAFDINMSTEASAGIQRFKQKRAKIRDKHNNKPDYVIGQKYKP